MAVGPTKAPFFAQQIATTNKSTKDASATVTLPLHIAAGTRTEKREKITANDKTHHENNNLESGNTSPASTSVSRNMPSLHHALSINEQAIKRTVYKNISGALLTSKETTLPADNMQKEMKPLWHFSQDDIYEITKTHVDTKPGICAALATLWIERRANGHSLKNYLETPSIADPNKVTTVIENSPALDKKLAAFTARKEKEIAKNINSYRQPINADRIRNAMQFSSMSYTLNPGAVIEQGLVSDKVKQDLEDEKSSRNVSHNNPVKTKFDKALKKIKIDKALKSQRKELVDSIVKQNGRQQIDSLAYWLETKNVTKFMPNAGQITPEKSLHANAIQNTRTPPSQNMDRGALTFEDFAKNMAYAMTTAPITTQGEVYQQVIIRGEKFGHMMAAAVNSDHSVTFFDPNYGEFFPQQKGQFISWLVDYFKEVGYDDPQISGKSYEILNFTSSK